MTVTDDEEDSPMDGDEGWQSSEEGGWASAVLIFTYTKRLSFCYIPFLSVEMKPKMLMI